MDCWKKFSSFLFLLSSKRISLSELTRQKYNFEDALVVYEELKLNNDILGTILDFSNMKNQVDNNYNNINNKDINDKKVLSSSRKKIGFIGSGNYAQSFLLPSLVKSKADLTTLVSRNPVSASYLGEKFKFINVSSDINDIMEDDNINTVFIVTNHDSHANLV